MSPPVDFEELGRRWEKARRGALVEVLAELPEACALESEDALRERAQALDLADTYRRVFDNSLRLGQGFARFHGVQVELADLPGLLPALGVPCLRGLFERVPGEAAFTFTRAGCGVPRTAKACDYWREASDGLVLGLTDGLRTTRHKSLGHGDSSCLDVFYENPESPLRYGVLDDEARAEEAVVRARVKKLEPSADVVFLGVSEGVLLYEMKTSGCGGLPVLKDLVERAVQKRFPQLTPREMTPRAVLEPDAA